jgi:hypothetical protein
MCESQRRSTAAACKAQRPSDPFNFVESKNCVTCTMKPFQSSCKFLFRCNPMLTLLLLPRLRSTVNGLRGFIVIRYTHSPITTTCTGGCCQLRSSPSAAVPSLVTKLQVTQHPYVLRVKSGFLSRLALSILSEHSRLPLLSFCCCCCCFFYCNFLL